MYTLPNAGTPSPDQTKTTRAPRIPLIDRLKSHDPWRRGATDRVADVAAGGLSVGVGVTIRVGAGPARTFTSYLDAEKVTLLSA